MLIIKIPLKTVSEANTSSEHWTKKHKRHKKQKLVVQTFLRPHKENIHLPCHITLTRIAPRKLDKDENLPMSFKYIKDYICDFITPGLQAGRADENPDLSFSFGQEKGKPKEYAIIIEIIHRN